MTIDILFGQSYYLRFDAKLWAAMQPYPPLGTLYAASYLRQRGYSVALFDAMLATEDEWATALATHTPRYAVLFEDNFNYLSKMCLLNMREAACRMMRLAKAHGCIVIACGADASDHHGLYLNNGADYVIVGEGEETLSELMDALNGKNDLTAYTIPGVRSPLTPHFTPRPLLRHLDDLPLPAWDLVNLKRYEQAWRIQHGYFSLNMVTTRGCPYHCNWCAKPIWGQHYHSRSPQNVVTEMKFLKTNYAPEHLWFADDILGLKPNWLAEFATLVQTQNAHIPFKCLLRADLVNEASAAQLAQAGCATVWLGAESGSQKILDAMDKGQQIEEIDRAVELLHAHGIKVGFFLQFGYPGETWVDIQLTRRMVRRCLPDDIGISVSYPLPGTKFYERVSLELSEQQNWIDSNDLAMLYHGPFSSEFYRTLHTLVHAEYRLTKIWRKRDWRRVGQVLKESVRWVTARIKLSRRDVREAGNVSTTTS